jgi:hypothetical protein
MKLFEDENYHETIDEDSIVIRRGEFETKNNVESLLISSPEHLTLSILNCTSLHISGSIPERMTVSG